MASWVRQSQLTCTLEELELYGNVVLREDEILYVIQEDGSRRTKFGDGITAIKDLSSTPIDESAGDLTLDGGFYGGIDSLTVSGGAVGNEARSGSGGAVGFGTVTSSGFAGGDNAKAQDLEENPIDAIQLGTGTNNVERSFNVYDYALLNPDGKIPQERIPKATMEMVFLSATDWVGTEPPYTYTLTVSGVTATSEQNIIPVNNISDYQLAAWKDANVVDGGQSANTIVLKAFGKKPTILIPIRIIKRGETIA